MKGSNSDSQTGQGAASARLVAGKEARKRVPRGSHGEWSPAIDRPDPLATLQAQDEGRIAARTRTHLRSLEDLTEVVDGRRRIRSAPPLLIPYRDMDKLAPGLLPADRKVTEQLVLDAWSDYLAGLLPGPSALERYLPKRRVGTPATRIVTGQQLMQATNDIFLGRHRGRPAGREFYWRQLKDMKGSFNVAALDKAGFETYVKVCAWCLARAHARTGDSVAIWAYIGTGDRFAQAIADFAVIYADQTEKDHQALQRAIQSGRIAAQTGI